VRERGSGFGFFEVWFLGDGRRGSGRAARRLNIIKKLYLYSPTGSFHYSLLRKPFFFNVFRFFCTADGFIPSLSASSVFEIAGLFCTKIRILCWLTLSSDHLSDHPCTFLSSTFSSLSSKYFLLKVTINWVPTSLIVQWIFSVQGSRILLA
jgi:hypothetical protein